MYLKKDSLGRSEIMGEGEFQGVINEIGWNPFKKIKRVFTGAKSNKAMISVWETKKYNPGGRRASSPYTAILLRKVYLRPSLTGLGGWKWKWIGSFYGNTREDALAKAQEEGSRRSLSIVKVQDTPVKGALA